MQVMWEPAQEAIPFELQLAVKVDQKTMMFLFSMSENFIVRIMKLNDELFYIVGHIVGEVSPIDEITKIVAALMKYQDSITGKLILRGEARAFVAKN